MLIEVSSFLAFFHEYYQYFGFVKFLQEKACVS